jgi:GxxExxY protein
MHENEISGKVLHAAIEVHKTLGGPGLLESVYEEALAWELTQSGLIVKRQLEVPLHYKGNRLATPLRLDLLVNDLVIVECKSTPKYNDIFAAQVLTYLRLLDLKLGLVLNFGEKQIKNGFHRVVMDYKHNFPEFDTVPIKFSSSLRLCVSPPLRQIQSLYLWQSTKKL